MIGYAGLSHLGVVSAAAAAAKGFQVVGFDPETTLFDALEHGDLPVMEPGLPQLLAANLTRLTFSDDPSRLRDCGVIYISVDVPIDDRGSSDLTPVDSLLETVVANSAPDAVVVVLSQVNPGFTRRRVRRVQTEKRRLLYQVETLIFGSAVERALYPERFVVGCADPAEPLPPQFSEYLAAFGCPILPMRLESAELTKIAINMFLTSAVTTTNMLAEICEAVGADWTEIAPSLRLVKRIGSNAYLQPGLGIGGTNLLRDMVTIQTIASEWGTDAAPVDAWIANSRWRRDWALRTLHRKVLGRTPTATVAVWGLAYKENTASTRNSPGVELLTALKGFRRRAYDPAARLDLPGDRLYVQCNAPIDACENADVLLIMTPWPELATVEPVAIRAAMRGRMVIDPFGLLSTTACAAAGLGHVRLGVSEGPGC